MFLFPHSCGAARKWRGVILNGAVVLKVKVFTLTRSDCCIPQASCVQMQLVWSYLDMFDSWIVLESNFWPQIADSFFFLSLSLAALTFDVITHIQSVSGVCLCLSACM